MITLSPPTAGVDAATNKKRPIDDDDTGDGNISNSNSASTAAVTATQRGSSSGVEGPGRGGGRLGKFPRPPMVPPPMLPPQRPLSPTDSDGAAAREKAGASPVQVPDHQPINESTTDTSA